jgi:hypothetical protein
VGEDDSGGVGMTMAVELQNLERFSSLERNDLEFQVSRAPKVGVTVSSLGSWLMGSGSTSCECQQIRQKIQT